MYKCFTTTENVGRLYIDIRLLKSEKSTYSILGMPDCFIDKRKVVFTFAFNIIHGVIG